MSEPVPQRIGDAERDRAASYLQEHLAQGRLTQDEFDERVGAALAARTRDDLIPLFSDLPAPRPDQSEPSTAWPAYAPPTADLPAPRTEASAPVPTAKEPPTVLAVVAAAAWPGWLILMFATGWHVWWLVFIPIFISSVVGKLYGDRREERHRDRYRHRGRRELED